MFGRCMPATILRVGLCGGRHQRPRRPSGPTVHPSGRQRGRSDGELLCSESFVVSGLHSASRNNNSSWVTVVDPSAPLPLPPGAEHTIYLGSGATGPQHQRESQPGAVRAGRTDHDRAAAVADPGVPPPQGQPSDRPELTRLHARVVGRPAGAARRERSATVRSRVALSNPLQRRHVGWFCLPGAPRDPFRLSAGGSSTARPRRATTSRCSRTGTPAAAWTTPTPGTAAATCCAATPATAPPRTAVGRAGTSASWTDRPAPTRCAPCPAPAGRGAAMSPMNDALANRETYDTRVARVPGPRVCWGGASGVGGALLGAVPDAGPAAGGRRSDRRHWRRVDAASPVGAYWVKGYSSVVEVAAMARALRTEMLSLGPLAVATALPAASTAR